jgi:kynurenine formamidase
MPTNEATQEPALSRDGVVVSRSPWGPEDEIGRLNLMTPESIAVIVGRLDGRRVFDLAVDYFIGMPSITQAGDPKYESWMTHTPAGTQIDDLTGVGGAVNDKYTCCGDVVMMYTHCGTHIDTLNHVGYFGCFWNGWTAERQLGSRHWAVGGPDNYPPLIARGVLVDVAAAHRVDCLPDSYEIGAAELALVARTQGVELRRGDVVLIRTGRMTRWPDPSGYLADSPGLGLEGARYLCEDVGAMCVGADTVGLEALPSEEGTFLPVHAYMFATAGSQIIEVVNCEELSRERQFEFAFIAAPIKLNGTTGAPVRPIAIPLTT